MVKAKIHELAAMLEGESEESSYVPPSQNKVSTNILTRLGTTGFFFDGGGRFRGAPPPQKSNLRFFIYSKNKKKVHLLEICLP